MYGHRKSPVGASLLALAIQQTHPAKSLPPIQACTDLAFFMSQSSKGQGMPGSPASHRLRLGRYAESSRVYLLTTNTFGRIPIFKDVILGRLVVEQFRKAQEQGWADSLAWVVMPDHFHWLIELRRGSLSELMQRIKSLSTKAVNLRLGNKVSLWQQGFHDRALRREDELIIMARYVVANPLRAGLVKRLGDYPLWDAIWL